MTTLDLTVGKALFNTVEPHMKMDIEVAEAMQTASFFIATDNATKLWIELAEAAGYIIDDERFLYLDFYRGDLM